MLASITLCKCAPLFNYVPWRNENDYTKKNHIYSRIITELCQIYIFLRSIHPTDSFVETNIIQCIGRLRDSLPIAPLPHRQHKHPMPQTEREIINHLEQADHRSAKAQPEDAAKRGNQCIPCHVDLASILDARDVFEEHLHLGKSPECGAVHAQSLRYFVFGNGQIHRCVELAYVSRWLNAEKLLRTAGQTVAVHAAHGAIVDALNVPWWLEAGEDILEIEWFDWIS